MERGALEQIDQVADARGLFGRGMRLVWSYIATHPAPFLASVIGAAVFAGATIMSTVVLGWVTDRVLVPAFRGGVARHAIWLGVAAVMSVAVLRAAGIMVRRYFSGVLGERVMATLRERVSDRYRELSLAFHRQKPAGELLAHMEADVMAAVEVLYPVPFAVGVMLLVLFAVVSLLLTDPVLSVVGFLMVPSLALLNRSFARRMQGPAQRAQQKIGEVSAVAHESIDGALIVKTLGRESAETGRLRAKAEELRGERIAAGYIRAGFEPALEALPQLAVILLLGLGAWRVSTGAVTIGTLVRFVALFNILSWPMRFIGWILSELPRAVVGHSRLTKVFEEPVTVVPATRPVPLPEGPLGLEAEAVTYLRGGRRVLDEVTFSVEPGESVALVGPTGSGKSTLAQLLVRLDDPDYGEIRIGDVNVRHADQRSLRDAAAVVFQESFLFATSVRENIALDTGAETADVEHAARLAQADRFVGALPNGFDTVVGERGHTLSGGERQRVALARALVRGPRLLILDDATSAVDPTIEADILAALRRELTTTLVVIAYRLSTIKLADRVLYLEDGTIAASGSHTELLVSSPGYATMIRAYERGER